VGHSGELLVHESGYDAGLRLGFNRQHSETTNLFANTVNLAGNAGLLGVAPDPFDWGAPNLSFSSIGSVRDTNPSMRTDRTLSVGDTITKTRGKQTLRFGGDYRDIHADSRTDANARGSFVFTGLYTGGDFADFLLGLPQQATKQFGPGPEHFRSTSWELFVQDDWRATDKVTVNAGLRYEYFSPLSEADNRLVTLDAAPGFTAAVPVAAGGTGPYSGVLPDTIVHPFRAGFAPRVGIAWRPKAGTVVRTGTASTTTRASISRSRSSSPVSRRSRPPTRSLRQRAGSSRSKQRCSLCRNTASNTYAVDPNYRLGYVQIWNLDLQRDLTRTVQFGMGYTGTRGANLDILRAPNRGASGLLIAGVSPFIWESSGADSIMNALTIRLRRRLSKGIAMGGHHPVAVHRRCLVGGGRRRRCRAERSGSGGGAWVVELRSASSLLGRLHLRAAVRCEQALVQQRRRCGRVRQLAAERQRAAGVRYAVHRARARQHSGRQQGRERHTESQLQRPADRRQRPLVHPLLQHGRIFDTRGGVLW
jgi:hypothetical protein